MNKRELIREYVEQSISAPALTQHVDNMGDKLINGLADMVEHMKDCNIQRAIIRHNVVGDVSVFGSYADRVGYERANKELVRYAADLHCKNYLLHVST